MAAIWVHEFADCITCHSWSPDESMIAFCPNNSEVHIYRLLDDKWDKLYVLQKHDQIVSGIDWSARSNKIVTVSHDRNSYVWYDRKLLMLSVDCMVPLETIELIRDELGLPGDFKKVLVPKYPHFFTVKDVHGRAHLCLENWDSSLAVTAREERFTEAGGLEPGGHLRKGKISKDGNFSGPFAFRLSYPDGFRPNVSYLEEVQRWQKLEFPSPYLNARRFDIADPKARKRVIGVLHELFSLTMEKRLTSAQVEAFHWEYRLPAKLLLCLIKHHGIFYITNKGARSTVFLKEAYDGSNLINKCPLLAFRDRFIALSGRGDTSLCTRIPFSGAIL
ncbi:hypothetical protein LIER_03225 [Lithospermum erythrorhizon]|uniref:PORR domain-containing protein n=1 Tax=Lithospermum erythrorhizon TaxID=34254 RepID=A0AAV3NTW6_LITER